MKAISINRNGGPEVLELINQPDPAPRANEVVVRLHAAGVNHVDVWVRKGGPAYPVTFPHVLGADGAGVVESVGSEAEGVSVGDRVIIFPGISCGRCDYCRKGLDNQCERFEILGTKRPGTYAEKIAVPDENVIVMPNSLSFENAASFGVAYGTAWHMISNRAALKKGETVLILGAGSGVGSASIQLARALGARVLALTTDGGKIESARKLGAEKALTIAKDSKFSEWVLSETGGKGADVVIEHVGPATWDESIKSTARYGRLVTCGATTGPTVTLDLRFLFSRNLTVFGARMSTKKDFQHLSSLIFSGQIKPKIDKVFPLDQAAASHQRLEDHSQMGKIVLKID